MMSNLDNKTAIAQLKLMAKVSLINKQIKVINAVAYDDNGNDCIEFNAIEYFETLKTKLEDKHYQYLWNSISKEDLTCASTQTQKIADYFENTMLKDVYKHDCGVDCKVDGSAVVAWLLQHDIRTFDKYFSSKEFDFMAISKHFLS